jgi:hypothetical protein
MIATSDVTAPMASNTDTMTGRTVCRNSMLRGARPAPPRFIARPITMNRTTGITSVPMAPIGSRMKILISSHVN